MCHCVSLRADCRYTILSVYKKWLPFSVLVFYLSRTFLRHHLSLRHTLAVSFKITRWRPFVFSNRSPSTTSAPRRLHERIKLEHSCHRASASLSGFLCCQISTAAATNILRHHIVKCLNLSMNPCCDLNPASKNSGLMSYSIFTLYRLG